MQLERNLRYHGIQNQEDGRDYIYNERSEILASKSGCLSQIEPDYITSNGSNSTDEGISVGVPLASDQNVQRESINSQW